jgi:hypothetical protein
MWLYVTLVAVVVTLLLAYAVLAWAFVILERLLSLL